MVDEEEREGCFLLSEICQLEEDEYEYVWRISDWRIKVRPMLLPPHLMLSGNRRLFPVHAFRQGCSCWHRSDCIVRTICRNFWSFGDDETELFFSVTVFWLLFVDAGPQGESSECQPGC